MFERHSRRGPARFSPNLLFASALVFAWVLLGSATPLHAAYFEFFTEEEVLKSAFLDGDTVVEVDFAAMDKDVKKKIEVQVSQTLVFRRMKCFQGSKGGKVTAYACIDNVIGRTKPITFMTKIAHPSGELVHYEIMVYREEIGKETGLGPFREQFYGKTTADPFEYGNDLRNYSGATLSANGLRDGFVKLLAVYNLFFKNLPILPAKNS